MSLKAKLEAVIYAAEEPVTLNQLAALFAADALEWKAAQEAAAREQTAEVAGVSPGAFEQPPLIGEGLEYLGLSDAPAVYVHEGTQPSTGAEPVAASEPAGSDGEPASADGHVPAEKEAAEPTVVSIGEAEAYPSIVVSPPELGSNPAEAAAAPSPDAGEPSPTTPLDAESEAKRLNRQRDREVKGILKHLLDELIASYVEDGRGVEIREIAGGYRMATKPECHDAVRLFVKSLKPPMKLSLPALETLAVIAYKQPVTAPEVNEIRGVESAGVLGSLLARKLIATAGRKPVIGRPILYKTTKEFLLRFGLKDVSELPSMEEFEKMAATELEMEPEVVESDQAADTAEAAEIAEASEENGTAALESNSPSGQELVAAAEIEAGTNESMAVNTDAAETGAVEPDAVEPDVAGAVSAETDSKVPGSGDGAETETSSNGEESKQEG